MTYTHICRGGGGPGRVAFRPPLAVGRGHASLLTDLNTWGGVNRRRSMSFGGTGLELGVAALNTRRLVLGEGSADRGGDRRQQVHLPWDVGTRHY